MESKDETHHSHYISNMKILRGQRSVLTPIGIVLTTILSVIFCILGLSGIILSIIELARGRAKIYHYDESQGGLTVENPLWPSSGKGIWVGLIYIATGLVGILATRERTHTAYVGFISLSGVSTVLSFYLLITCIIPVRYDTNYFEPTRPDWLLNELIINSLLIVVGGLGIFCGIISMLIGSIFVDCWQDQRIKYPAVYKDDPAAVL